ncbi:hypothetical protein EVAR_24617_1 [Eumeta japonica]|uniref:Uncharacterized protein n=1 Tax=Eumeta variegata TaxID=151549 RepID=A0A4C1V118_EUMVA|nr:hypothetical protein EVAR_24617_1 [Eumeta japonica]
MAPRTTAPRALPVGRRWVSHSLCVARSTLSRWPWTSSSFNVVHLSVRNPGCGRSTFTLTGFFSHRVCDVKIYNPTDVAARTRVAAVTRILINIHMRVCINIHEQISAGVAKKYKHQVLSSKFQPKFALGGKAGTWDRSCGLVQVQVHES